LKKVLLVILVAVVAIQWDSIRRVLPGNHTYGDYQVQPVVLYATEWCGFCKKTRDLLAQHNIDYLEYDIEKSEEGRAQYDDLGGRGVPVLLINGEVVRGFNASRILELARQ